MIEIVAVIALICFMTGVYAKPMDSGFALRLMVTLICGSFGLLCICSFLLGDRLQATWPVYDLFLVVGLLSILIAALLTGGLLRKGKWL